MAKSFEQWKAEVDKILERLCGMCSEDLPDWDYYSAWDEEMTPLSAAKSAIKAAGGF